MSNHALFTEEPPDNTLTDEFLSEIDRQFSEWKKQIEAEKQQIFLEDYSLYNLLAVESDAIDRDLHYAFGITF